jgi:hypothetical protein
MDFLDVHINKDGISIGPAKISGIADWPEELTMVKQVLGICGYHWMHIPRFCFIAACLTRLTSKDIPFKWTDECHQAVWDLKKAVTTALVLICPDTIKQFELEVNVLAIVTGAVLYQRDAPVTLPSGKEKPRP